MCTRRWCLCDFFKFYASCIFAQYRKICIKLQRWKSRSCLHYKCHLIISLNWNDFVTFLTVTVARQSLCHCQFWQSVNSDIVIDSHCRSDIWRCQSLCHQKSSTLIVSDIGIYIESVCMFCAQSKNLITCVKINVHIHTKFPEVTTVFCVPIKEDCLGHLGLSIINARSMSFCLASVLSYCH